MNPVDNQIPEFYQRYISLVNDEPLIPSLINNGNEFIDLLKSIPEQSGGYRYAAGKWTVKEVVSHMIDAERVFAFRALWFARNSPNPLPGYEENDWAVNSNAENRKLYKLIGEYNNVRASTIDLFSSFTKEMLDNTGKANGIQSSVLDIGYILLGHEQHHINILKARYFAK